jgi:arylsulfatase A-like enzyme
MTPEQRESFNGAYQAENDAFLATNLQGDDLVRWKYQRYLRDYLRCIASVDDNIGRLLDYLDDSGLADNTVVVYLSDQGLFLGEHGWFDKRWMYEESLRFPLLIKDPRSAVVGQVRTDMVMNVDLAPTLLDLVGIPAPEDMQGRSLVPLLAGDTVADWREEVYYHYYEFPYMTHVNPHYGIRDERYKLIRFYKDVEGWEFYDLQDDPTEQRNVYREEEYRRQIDRMKERLKTLRVKYQDETPAPGAGRSAMGTRSTMEEDSAVAFR